MVPPVNSSYKRSICIVKTEAERKRKKKKKKNRGRGWEEEEGDAESRALTDSSRHSILHVTP